MTTPQPTPEQLAMAAAAQKFNVEAFTLLGVATVFVILRWIQRGISVGVRNWALDDYLMGFALVLYGLETGAAYSVGEMFHGLANSGMSPEQRLALDPASQEYSMRQGGSKLQVIGWNIYTMLLWTLKLCMCIFYNRLTQGLDHIKLRIRIGYVAIISTYIATMMSILLACHPFNRNWQINPDPGNTCQPAISKVNCLVTVVLNVLTDLYLLSIPLPLLWGANMPLKRKALLLFMFSGGFFVIACGILRCALILIDPVNGAQQAGSWAVRETFVSVMIGNMPMVYKLFRMATKSTIDTVKSRSRHTQLYDQDGNTKERSAVYYRGDGGRSGPASAVSKRSRFLHPLSLRNITASGSSDDLHLETIKESGIVMTHEFSVQEEGRATPDSPDRPFRRDAPAAGAGGLGGHGAIAISGSDDDLPVQAHGQPQYTAPAPHRATADGSAHIQQLRDQLYR